MTALIRRLAAALAAVFIFSTAASAADILAVTENYPPYSFSEEGKVAGLAAAVVRTILDESGLEYNVALYPWARAYRTALDDSNVLIFSLVRTKEREDSFIWLAKIHTPEFYLYARNDGEYDLKQIKQRKLRAVSLRDDIACVWLERLGFSEKDGSLHITSDYEKSPEVTIVANRRADFFIGDPFYTSIRIQRAGFEEKNFKKILRIRDAGEDSFYLAAGKKTDPRYIEKIRKAIANLRTRGVPLMIRKD